MIEPERLLGRSLEEALEALEEEGSVVRLVEVSSRKGVLGNSRRVIRARRLCGGEMELCYSVFKTDLRYMAE